MNDNMCSAFWLLLFPNVANMTLILYEVLKDSLGKLQQVV